jgi:hypothetical protein
MALAIQLAEPVLEILMGTARGTRYEYSFLP